MTPPYYETYNDIYLKEDPGAIQQMKYNMVRLQDELSIEYYDFSTDEEFVSRYDLYKDSDHLNVCGARLFT